MDTKFKTAAQDVARMSHEMRAMKKTLEATKGHVDNAPSRICDLERELSLRTDEFKDFREERLMQNSSGIVSEGNMRRNVIKLRMLCVAKNRKLQTMSI